MIDNPPLAMNLDDSVKRFWSRHEVFMRWRPFLLFLTSATIFLGVWQFTSTYLVNPYLLPPPSRIFRVGVDMTLSGEIFSHVGISMTRVMAGFILGSVIAIVLGVLMGRLELIRGLMDPIIEVLRYLSPTAMIPIAVIWFGIGEASKYFLVFWGTFFFVLINTIAGVMLVPATRIRAARCLGASHLRIFLTVVIPSAVPYMITGMRIGMASSFMSIIPAEMLAADSGIGFMLQTAGILAQTERIFVALVVISLLGFATDRVFRRLVSHFLRRYMAHVVAA